MRLVELMVVVVGQEAGGVSEAAGSSCSSSTCAPTAAPHQPGDPASGKSRETTAGLA